MEITPEIKQARLHLYEMYAEPIKKHILEHGDSNPFMETKTIDVTGLDIELREGVYIDTVYYIPSKDELGYIVYNDETHSRIFRQSAFVSSKGNVDLVLISQVYAML